VKKGMPPLAFRSRKHTDRPKVQSHAQSTPKENVPGPEIVIDYSYAEDSTDHDNPDAPIVIRNASPTYPAYNIEVLPLETDQGTAPFAPALIPYIEPAGTQKVFANIEGGSRLFRKRLPNFLFKSYKDASGDELFGTKSFALRVRYTGTGHTIFETECELLFRPWKKETKIGRIDRRVLKRPVQSGGRTRLPVPEILSAKWGTGGANYKDKTNLLVGYLQAKRQDLRASNEFFHDDYPGHAKHLIVKYNRQGSREWKILTFAENDLIRFPNEPAVERNLEDSRVAESRVGVTPEVSPNVDSGKEPTLSSLMNADFPSLMKLHGKPVLQFADGTSCEIEDVLYVDFRSGSKFIGIYVPSSPKSLQVLLSTSDIARQLGDELAKDLRVTSKMPGENPQDIATLTYTGRVYLYHQDHLTHRNIADIEDAFRKHNMDAVLRGPDFLTTAWIEWKRKSTEKPMP
jgi:hypothetical protein